MSTDEIDPGPNRKTRVRKRSSSDYEINGSSNSRPRLVSSLPESPPRTYCSSSKQVTPTKVSAVFCQSWFANSFGEQKWKEFEDLKNSSVKPPGLSSGNLDVLETSDTILASLDMPCMTSGHEIDKHKIVDQSARSPLEEQGKDKNTQEDRSQKPTENSLHLILSSEKCNQKLNPSCTSEIKNFSTNHNTYPSESSTKTFSQESSCKANMSLFSSACKSNLQTNALQVPVNRLHNKTPVLFVEPDEQQETRENLDTPSAEYFSDCDIFTSAFSPMGENTSTPNIHHRSLSWKKRNFEAELKTTTMEKNANEDVAETDKTLKTKNEEKDLSGDIKSNMEKQTTALTTETTASSSSLLKNRIRQRLFQNAKEKSPISLVSNLQQEKLALAKECIETFQKEKEAGHTNFELGPFYGLPSKVKHLFESQRGIKKLYDWQEECLSLPALVSGSNLIYSLPTSGGKTLVAEILILRELLCKKKNAMLILPYISIVQEKVKSLSEMAVELDFLVEEYAGSKGRYPPTKRREKSSLYVATIEKAHSLVNQFIELDRMNTLGLVVVDELHMLGEGGSRGAILEATLIKILNSEFPCQVIGMSATLNNMDDLKSFLKADLYTNNFRPVTLTEYVKISENIYHIDQNSPENPLQHDRITNFQYKPEMNKTDPDHLFGLVLEVIPTNSCLLFCPTKKNCENVSSMLCKLMSKYRRELLERHKSEKKILLQELKSDNNGHLCPILQTTIPFGVAYHHSGLMVDERKLIEDAYSSGTLCLLTCTSTLAAGVNLPAKRVILRAPRVGNSFISKCQYKQMVGRAGRAGIDSSGESIMISQPQELPKVCNLISSPIENCHSSLMYDNGKGIRFLILSIIGLQIAASHSNLFSFLHSSLLYIQSDVLLYDVKEVVHEELQTLVDLGLVVQKRKTDLCDVSSPAKEKDNSDLTLEITKLGKATYKGSIDIDIGPRLYKDLKAACDKLVLSNYLHLLALVTPYNLPITPCWMTYFNQMCKMSPEELSVADLLGVPEGYIARKAGGQRVKQQSVDQSAIDRFYLTLMLHEVWKRKTIWEVASMFNQPRGFIQNLVTSSCSFATCVLHFCQELEELWMFQSLFTPFIQQLSYNVVADLVPLLEIPGVKKARASQLFNAGYKTLASIASADIGALVRSIDHLSKKVARQMVASAKLLLEEKKAALLEEIEQLVSIPSKMATDLPLPKPIVTDKVQENDEEENNSLFSDNEDFDYL